MANQCSSILAKLNAFELHKLVMHRLKLQSEPKTKTDLDVIRENHRFLWDDDDQKPDEESWEQRLAKKYYAKLFKEYCICDLTRFKENRVAMRWRTEAEVVMGKGQFICGSKSCQEKDELRSWEVNFTYVEQEEKKNALVKLRLCVSCSKKLNYHSTKRLIKKQKRLKDRRPAAIDSNCKELPSTSGQTTPMQQPASPEEPLNPETVPEKDSSTNSWSDKGE